MLVLAAIPAAEHLRRASGRVSARLHAARRDTRQLSRVRATSGVEAAADGTSVRRYPARKAAASSAAGSAMRGVGSDGARSVLADEARLRRHLSARALIDALLKPLRG